LLTCSHRGAGIDEDSRTRIGAAHAAMPACDGTVGLAGAPLPETGATIAGIEGTLCTSGYEPSNHRRAGSPARRDGDAASRPGRAEPDVDRSRQAVDPSGLDLHENRLALQIVFDSESNSVR
jgi:hypothetical protein